MSFLYSKKTKEAMRWIWIFFSVLIILSMTLAFSGGQGLFSGDSSASHSQVEATDIPANLDEDEVQELPPQIVELTPSDEEDAEVEIQEIQVVPSVPQQNNIDFRFSP